MYHKTKKYHRHIFASTGVIATIFALIKFGVLKLAFVKIAFVLGSLGLISQQGEILTQAYDTERYDPNFDLMLPEKIEEESTEEKQEIRNKKQDAGDVKQQVVERLVAYRDEQVGNTSPRPLPVYPSGRSADQAGSDTPLSNPALGDGTGGDITVTGDGAENIRLEIAQRVRQINVEEKNIEEKKRGKEEEGKRGKEEKENVVRSHAYQEEISDLPILAERENIDNGAARGVASVRIVAPERVDLLGRLGL